MRLGLASSTRDVDLIAPQYADPFMLADPNGARVVQKASLLAVFPNGLQLLRTQGHTSTTYGPLVKTLSMNTIGSRAQFVWCFEKPGAPAVEVDVDTTFMVYVNGVVSMIVFQQEREDFRDALRSQGISLTPA
jgi:hypothetical protein